MSRFFALFFIGFVFCHDAYAQGWIWGRGTIGNNVTSWPVATDPAGNAFVAGISSGEISFEHYGLPFTGTGDLCELAKYDGYGHFLWARSTPEGSHSFLINIATDLAGNCYLLGWMLDSTIQLGSFTLINTAWPNAQYFIAKYDGDGNVTWAKNAGGRSGTNVAPPVAFNGGSTAKMLSLGAIATGPDGDVYVTTCFNLPTVTIGSNTLINKDNSGATDDILLIKYDSLGNLVWAKSAGGTGNDIPFSIAVTPAGSVYIAGMFNSDSVAFGPLAIADTGTGPQRWNAFIARYDTAGSPTWASGSSGSGMVYASGVTTDVHNNVYLTGGTAEDQLSFAGTGFVNPYPGQPVQYIVKLNADNNFVWSKSFGSSTGGNTWGYGITYSPMGQVWVSGAFSDQVRIDGQVLVVPPASVDPVFIAGFDTSGYYTFGGVLQSGSTHQANIACDPYGNVLLCSDYKYPCTPFIIANDVLATVTTAETWQYLAKYSFISGSGPGSGQGSGQGAGGGLDGGAYTIYTEFDTSMCPSDNMLLVAPPGYSLYTWGDGSSDSVLHIAGAGTYTVKGLGNTDVAIVETFNVKTDSGLCNCNTVIPNAFTPNGDGLNDDFGPVFDHGCAVNFYAFSIYNRWGQCVFFTKDPYAKWDGRYNGVYVDLDVYKFYLVYSTNPNYPQHTRKGDVTVVR